MPAPWRRNGATFFAGSWMGLGQAARNSIGLDGLHLNAQEYVLVESILLGVVHTEVRAIEAAAGVGAADLLLEHRMVDAFKRVDGERDRFGHAMKRQIAADHLRCSIRKIHEFPFVFSRR